MRLDGRHEPKWTFHAGEQATMKTHIPPATWGGFTLPDALNSEPWSALLDFGCGTGLWREVLRGGRYVGVDQNPAMIEGAKARWAGDDAEFLLCPDIVDGSRMPFADGEFDVAITIAVMQHNEDGDDKSAVLREIRRVLRTGGRYMCFENTHDREWNPWPGPGQEVEDGFSHTLEGWVSTIEPFGFICERKERPGFYVFRAI